MPGPFLCPWDRNICDWNHYNHCAVLQICELKLMWTKGCFLTAHLKFHHSIIVMTVCCCRFCGFTCFMQLWEPLSSLWWEFIYFPCGTTLCHSLLQNLNVILNVSCMSCSSWHTTRSCWLETGSTPSVQRSTCSPHSPSTSTSSRSSFSCCKLSALRPSNPTKGRRTKLGQNHSVLFKTFALFSVGNHL